MWLVGETGLLVGTSLNALLRRRPDDELRGRRPPRATTLTELPYADVALWQQQFETWWSPA